MDLSSFLSFYGRYTIIVSTATSIAKFVLIAGNFNVLMLPLQTIIDNYNIGLNYRFYPLLAEPDSRITFCPTLFNRNFRTGCHKVNNRRNSVLEEPENGFPTPYFSQSHYPTLLPSSLLPLPTIRNSLAIT